MALIKCSECGKEISDKAAACVHCGCPISASTQKPSSNIDFNKFSIGGEKDNTLCLSVEFNAVVADTVGGQTQQTVFVQALGRNVEFPINNNTKVNEVIRITLVPGSKYQSVLFKAVTVTKKQTAASINSDHTDIINIIKRYDENFLARVSKSKGVIKFASLFISFAVVGAIKGIDLEVLAPFGIIGVILLMMHSYYPASHIKRYFRKHGVHKAIRSDTGYMRVAISAFNVWPTTGMLAYIRKLNPAAASEIDRQHAEKKKNKKK